jgi:hypothetical protein
MIFGEIGNTCLLMFLNELLFWCVCVGGCTSTAILFLETLSEQSVEAHSSPSYAQRSCSTTTNATASLHTCSASSTCETWRYHPSRSWRAKEKEVCKLMSHDLGFLLYGDIITEHLKWVSKRDPQVCPQGCQFPSASVSPTKEENQRNLGITFCLTSWSKLTMHCMFFDTVALVYIKFIQLTRQVSGWT